MLRRGYTDNIQTDALTTWQAIVAGTTHYEVVITDLTMPGMIRIELAERVHARDHEARLILIGNFATSVGVEPLRVIGFVEALQKPMKMSALAHAVDRVLAVRG